MCGIETFELCFLKWHTKLTVSENVRCLKFSILQYYTFIYWRGLFSTRTQKEWVQIPQVIISIYTLVINTFGFLSSLLIWLSARLLCVLFWVSRSQYLELANETSNITNKGRLKNRNCPLASWLNLKLNLQTNQK